MSPNPLTETVFKATTEGKMSNVTQQPGGCIDIWPYVRMVQQSVELPQQVIDGQLCHLWRGDFRVYSEFDDFRCGFSTGAPAVSIL
jgi:hypothetical protein